MELKFTAVVWTTAFILMTEEEKGNRNNKVKSFIMMSSSQLRPSPLGL